MAEPTKIYQMLRKAQTELHVPKKNYNSFGKYSYRSAEDIVEAAKLVLDEVGLTLLITDSVEQVGERYYVHATASVFNTEGHTVAAHGWAREPEDKKGMDSSQITGTASSYARKYALNGLFAIDDTKDADSDEHNQEVQNRPRPVPNEPATDAQRQAIRRHLDKQGISVEKSSSYLADTYGVKIPLTKAGAAKVIEAIISSDADSHA